MSNHPFVSVIVPVHNNPEGMDLLLTRLVKQSYQHNKYEVIVADNGSTDNTREVVFHHIENHPGMVKIVSENTVQGSYAARNKGIAIAKGEVLAFIDSDCVPSPTWIELGIAELINQSAAAGGGHVEFTFREECPNIYEYFDSARKLDQKSYVESHRFAATANFFAYKTLFDHYGPFRSDLISGGDYEFGRRITNHGESLIYLEKAAVYHPARHTFSAIYEKSKRIAIGQKHLRNLGLLEHGKLSARNILPIFRWPKDEKWGSTLTIKNKVQLLLLQNFFLIVRWWIQKLAR